MQDCRVQVMAIEIRVAASADAELFAGIHAGCFDDHWSAASFRSLLDSPGVFGLAAGRDVRGQVESFILVRVAADEAEILTLATLPDARRHGLASRLVGTAMEQAKTRGALRLFLEVAEANQPGRRLYEKLCFERAALRPDYYKSATNAAIAAVVMRRELSD